MVGVLSQKSRGKKQNQAGLPSSSGSSSSSSCSHHALHAISITVRQHSEQISETQNKSANLFGRHLFVSWFFLFLSPCSFFFAWNLTSKTLQVVKLQLKNSSPQTRKGAGLEISGNLNKMLSLTPPEIKTLILVTFLKIHRKSPF